MRNQNRRNIPLKKIGRPIWAARVGSTNYAKELPRHTARQKPFQLPRPYRVLKLTNRLGFNLAHALARHLEDSADFFEGVGVAVADAVAEFDDLALAVCQRFEDLLDLILEHFLGGAFDAVV